MIPTPLTTDSYERVVCLGTLPDGSACQQLLARRYGSGAVVVVVRGDERYESDGRIVIHCPSCGRRVRIKPKRAA